MFYNSFASCSVPYFNLFFHFIGDGLALLGLSWCSIVVFNYVGRAWLISFHHILYLRLVLTSLCCILCLTCGCINLISLAFESAKQVWFSNCLIFGHVWSDNQMKSKTSPLFKWYDQLHDFLPVENINNQSLLSRWFLYPSSQ